MTKLTLEQKAKRYDYLEKELLTFLEQQIADAKYDDSHTKYVDVLEEWIDHVDFHNDIVPRGIYLLFDKILDENYGKYISNGKFLSVADIGLKNISKEYKAFEKKIGG